MDGDSNTDKLAVDLSRTTIDNSHVVINMYGGAGSDTLDLLLPDSSYYEGISATVGTPSRVNANIYTGGSGSDSSSNKVNVSVPSYIRGGAVGSGSDVDIDIEGDRGVDTVNANPLSFQLSRASRLNLDAVLYDGKDKFYGVMNFSSSLNGTPTFLNGLIGPHPIESGAFSLAHFGVQGGNHDDTIDFRNSAPPGSVSNPLFGKFEFDLAGGANNDKIQLHLDSSVVDPDSYLVLAGGEFAAFLNGDTGDDFLEIDVNFYGGVVIGTDEVDTQFVPIASGLIDLAIYGGANKDKAVMAVNNFGAGIRGLLMDGGRDYDIYDIDGNINAVFSDIIIRGFEKEDDLLEKNETVIVLP